MLKLVATTLAVVTLTGTSNNPPMASAAPSAAAGADNTHMNMHTDNKTNSEKGEMGAAMAGGGMVDKYKMCNHTARVAVANRGSGTFSIVDVANMTVHNNVTLPGKGEPMYISTVEDDLWVGDRAAGAVHVYAMPSYTLKKTISTGAGVFHSMSTQTDDGMCNKSTTQVWVNNDINGTTTVISALNYTVLAQIPTPADLAKLGGKPHDVTADQSHGWVTYVGFNDSSVGYVVAFSTKNFKETGRAKVGGDPHVAQRPATHLFVASQAANMTYVLNKTDMTVLANFTVPSSHGLWVTTKGHLYNTNIMGGGKAALHSFIITAATTNTTTTSNTTTTTATSNTTTNTYLTPHNNASDVPSAVPHNVAVDDMQMYAYIAHSGPNSTTVTVTPLEKGAAKKGAKVTTITTGKNPFGIYYFHEMAC